MSAIQTQVCAPSITISRNRMRAVLHLPACSPLALASEMALTKLVRDHGLDVDEAMQPLLREIAMRFAMHRQDIDETLAEGIAPKPGHPGRIEWVPMYAPDPPQRPITPTDERVNFYEQCPYRFVEADVHIATIIPPRPGRSGMDVYGDRVLSEGADPYHFIVDDTVAIELDGRVVTRKAGLLDHIDLHHFRVTPVLHIHRNVDFSTGNIRFDGSVFVGGDVRDHFEIHCTGDLQVHGFIEAATINCGGTLHATGGIACKESGSIAVVSDTWAHYLDGVRGEIGGRLMITREIITSQLTVLGDLQMIGGSASGGAIIGGHLTCGGAVSVYTLGSAAAIATELRLGYVPNLTEALNKHEPDVGKIEQALRRCREAIEAETDPQRRRELLLRASQILAQRTQVIERRRQMIDSLNTTCRVELDVATMIHPGVRIDLPRWRVEVLNALPGPIRLVRQPDGRPRFERPDGGELNVGDAVRISEITTW